MCVLLEVDDILVMCEGGVIVLDLLIDPELLVMVDDLDMPAGLVIVLDFIVTFVAGAWVEVRVVIFEELVLILVVAGGGVVVVVAGVVAGVWAWANVLTSRLSERRKPTMRFIKKNMKGENLNLLRASGRVVSRQCSNFSRFA